MEFKFISYFPELFSQIIKIINSKKLWPLFYKISFKSQETLIEIVFECDNIEIYYHLLEAKILFPVKFWDFDGEETKETATKKFVFELANSLSNEFKREIILICIAKTKWNEKIEIIKKIEPKIQKKTQ
jgi:hypothetical protein